MSTYLLMYRNRGVLFPEQWIRRGGTTRDTGRNSSSYRILVFITGGGKRCSGPPDRGRDAGELVLNYQLKVLREIERQEAMAIRITRKLWTFLSPAISG